MSRYRITHSNTHTHSLTHLGFGVFTSISFCYIECDDALCSNAINACQSLHLCQGVLRSDLGRSFTCSLTHSFTHLITRYAGRQQSITGQLARLVHFNRNNHEFKQQLQQQACFSHGRNVSQSELGRKFIELNKQKQSIIGAPSLPHSLTHSLTHSLIHIPDDVKRRNGVILYVHFRKSGGSTMCNLAQLNGLKVPSNDKNVSARLNLRRKDHKRFASR